MKVVLLVCVVFSLSFSAVGQRSAPAAKPRPRATPVQKKAPADPAAEKKQLDNSIAEPTAAKKVEMISAFVHKYPASAEKNRALESLTVARAALGDEKFEAGENDQAVELFRLAINEAPRPYPERLFREVISRIPTNLYFRGKREAAFAAAAEIEKETSGNVGQILLLANFYLATESADQAARIADIALKIDPASAAAYLVQANAQRMNFDLDAAAASFARAYELDNASVAAKRGLAEMKRALEKASDAVDLYREILDKNTNDHQARTGLILALFDAGKRQEAESEMAKAIALGTGNVVLISSAAYWYATQFEGTRAVELGRQAVATEPRYIWSHLALARGLLAQRNPLEAERVLTNARKYGKFPTLEYEIANARLMSGFYQEAALELGKSFRVVDGGVEVRLGGRVLKRDKSLADLIGYERRASIFEPATSDTPETAERLRTLLDLYQKLETPNADEAVVSAAADAFVNGDDRMKLHRQIFAANALVQKKVALSKALELTRAALGRADEAVDVPNAAAAIMANALYDSRTLAFSRGEFLLVPDVPKQTLSAIFRGRIEEIAGGALYGQGNYADAVVRLRRAVSVYPEKSAWWRSGMWQLGAALQADGKEREALDSFIKSYKIDKPDSSRYAAIETLYLKLNGKIDGLESEIGANPAKSPAVVAEKTADLVAAPPGAEVSSATAASPLPAMPAEAAKEAVMRPETEPTPLPDAVNAKTQVEETAPPSGTPINAAIVTTQQTVAQPKTAEPVIATNTPDTTEEAKTEPAKDGKVGELEITAATAPAVVPSAINGTPAIKERIDSLRTATSTPQPAKEPEPKAAEKSLTARQPGKTPTSNRPLFEPIIITIPNNAPNKIAAAKGDPATAEGAKTEAVPCILAVSDESVSVVNDGGSIGILLSLSGDHSETEVAAASSSPENLEVKPDAQAAGSKTRRFFLVRSISPALGLYDVTFSAPCGKAIVSVKVR